MDLRPTSQFRACLPNPNNLCADILHVRALQGVVDPGFKPAESFGISMYADGLDEPEGRSAIVCGNQGYQGSPVPVFFENRPAEAGDRVGLLLDLTAAGRLTAIHASVLDPIARAAMRSGAWTNGLPKKRG